ncbi:30S ribosomal protein S19 [Candidatus Woesearchaeota archaeon]|nr:30S ribosomal protein S19 [Candidatus Woesearchaeota archaeon]
MAKKEFTYRGKRLEELQALTLAEIGQMLPSRARRSLKRGLRHEQKVVLEKVGAKDPDIRTHCRDLVVLPAMVGATIKIHTGKEFFPVQIQPEMIGHFLGEFALTRKGVTHSAPGLGATKSSSNVAVK